MEPRVYFLVTAILFVIVAVLHAARLFFGWEFAIGGWAVPPWASWLAIAAAGGLAYFGMRLFRGSR
jgi:hypothetical protein